MTSTFWFDYGTTRQLRADTARLLDKVRAVIPALREIAALNRSIDRRLSATARVAANESPATDKFDAQASAYAFLSHATGHEAVGDLLASLTDLLDGMQLSARAVATLDQLTATGGAS